MEREALWRKVIIGIYGEDDARWVPKSVPKHHKSGVWGNILRFKVGEGSRAHFLRDDWLGLGPLRVSFPSLFKVAVNKFVS